MTLCEKYGYKPEANEIETYIEGRRSILSEYRNREVLSACLGMIDLTSLNVSDTTGKISSMVEKVNSFKSEYPDLPLPASICVYPNFASTVARLKSSEEVHVTVVGGCFPASQSFPEVKKLECAMAVRDGADEVDIVLAQNAFLAGACDEASREISETGLAVRSINPDAVLKVILETGTLTPEQIAEASFLAMEAGADFIKTSTGKVSPAATPSAAVIMCRCISRYFEVTGRRVGFKPAGGISSADDAVLYWSIVDGILGREWLDRRYFRFGASRMANNLLSELTGETVRYY